MDGQEHCVGEMMHPPQALIDVDASPAEARARLSKRDADCLIVVDGDQVVGLLPSSRSSRTATA